MESNQNGEESKSSSEETVRFERDQYDDSGTGRSYECVFCKRGFTTAQALGGHMNIHRKDRSRTTRPSSVNPSISSKVNEDFVSSRAYPSNQSYPSHEVHTNWQPFFPPSSSSSWGVNIRPSSHEHYRNYVCEQNSQHSNPFEDDWQKGLNLRIGLPSHENDSRGKVEDGNEVHDELDLELRLGHNP